MRRQENCKKSVASTAFQTRHSIEAADRNMKSFNFEVWYISEIFHELGYVPPEEDVIQKVIESQMERGAPFDTLQFIAIAEFLLSAKSENFEVRVSCFTCDMRVILYK